MRKKHWNFIASAIIILVCLGICVFLVDAYFDGKFDSVESLQEFIAGFGIWGPLILTLIQAAQVVIPVLPGFLGCAVGSVMFGWFWGFWCNYIGISLGSIIAYYLARRFGKAFVKPLFPEKLYDKWSTRAAHSKSYTVFLFLGMLLPLFPDDFFCYFTGLTDMTPKKFIWIIILGKPWCLLAYSLGFALI